MATHYAFVIYCMEVIALLGWIIILCKANGGIIFEVQTFQEESEFFLSGLEEYPG